jgi:hypothetical protein
MSELPGVLSLFFIVAAFVTSCSGTPQQAPLAPTIIEYVAR